MNGKKGDAPFTDIVWYGEEVFHPKVDQLIRELDAVGGFEDPFAQAFVDAKAIIWDRLEDLLEDERAASPRRRWEARENWLRNFAFQLWLRLIELRGEPKFEPGTLIRLPAEWDPTVP